MEGQEGGGGGVRGGRRLGRLGGEGGWEEVGAIDDKKREKCKGRMEEGRESK